MTLEKVMGGAVLSRLMGGLIFDDMCKPIKPKDLVTHYASVKAKTGKATYYHLNEETAILTRYLRVNGGGYRTCEAELIDFRELDRMQLAYEQVTGFDLRNCRTRVPLYGDRLDIL